jgi:hypothetical protein
MRRAGIVLLANVRISTMHAYSSNVENATHWSDSGEKSWYHLKTGTTTCYI